MLHSTQLDGDGCVDLIDRDRTTYSEVSPCSCGANDLSPVQYKKAYRMAIRRRIAAAAMARIPSNVRRVPREIGAIS